ncbi:MAG: hypothetical protein QNJ31_02780 [Candidatus Caenarcaniphilales bacterium]|nr:hypothetical protein [Candidatus Caenarcaniphilales bacterium]
MLVKTCRTNTIIPCSTNNSHLISEKIGKIYKLKDRPETQQFQSELNELIEMKNSIARNNNNDRLIQTIENFGLRMSKHLYFLIDEREKYSSVETQNDIRILWEELSRWKLHSLSDKENELSLRQLVLTFQNYQNEIGQDLLKEINNVHRLLTTRTQVNSISLNDLKTLIDITNTRMQENNNQRLKLEKSNQTNGRIIKFLKNIFRNFFQR